MDAHPNKQLAQFPPQQEAAMSHPTVLRVQPLYEKPGPRRISIEQSAAHNARTGGNIAHVDAHRIQNNVVLLGTGDINKDVSPLLLEYPRASKTGPIAGEVIITANKDFFETLSDEKRTQWAKDSLDWAIAEFDYNSKGKVVSCIWHRDEEAEHLHIIVVPIVTCTTGNQYRQKITTKINYSKVLGKPRGGEKDIPPSERLWGKKQTSYADFIAERGHQLVRGVKNRRWRKHISPAEHRQKTAKAMENFQQRLDNLELEGTVTKKEVFQYTAHQISKLTSEMKKTINAQENRLEALQQVINEAAKTLQCEHPSQLSQYVKHLTIGITSIQHNPEELAQKGKAIEKSYLESEAAKEKQK